MVPRIAKIGHSFKGAGMYYLHDKKADTDDRVAWTHIHNIPTNSPSKAFDWMAYTAMNANKLKQQAGIPMTGRKSTSGTVYSFSLAWHPEQKPDKQTMLDAAFETLGLLRLEEHEAVMVAHKDTAHPHVHVICNLVNPENGKKAVMSYDRLTMSQWAEKTERNDGEILCEQRVINNEQRRLNRDYNKMFALVKHKEQKLEMSAQIQELYERSDNAQSFQASLEDSGYTLAKGDRRGFVLVDSAGEIYALSRQLKGQRAKDIKTRLHDIGELPVAKEIAFERKHFDRDQYETERQKKIVDAAIEEAEKKIDTGKQKTPSLKEEQQEPETNLPNPDNEHLEQLDRLRAWEQKNDRQKTQLEEEQKQYGCDEITKRIKALEDEIANPSSLWDKATRKKQAKLDELSALKKSLDNIDMRIREQNAAFEKKAQESKPDLEQDQEAIKKQRAAEILKKMKPPERKEDRGNEPDMER